MLPPPFEWCEVPIGKVTVTDVGGYLGGFWMAKYPITNGQFQVFVDAQDGYRDVRWWDYSDAAQTWRKEEEYMKPAAVSLQAGDDFPRTDVSWYEAVAFCRWLTEKALILHPSGTSDHWEIRLPSEQEWQRAAQGNDGREYPWGNRFDKARANTFESGIGAATPVTRFTGGASPFGVMDMCGNVWEWCLTDLNTGSRDTSVNGPRMLRGACCPPAYLPRH